MSYAKWETGHIMKFNFFGNPIVKDPAHIRYVDRNLQLEDGGHVSCDTVLQQLTDGGWKDVEVPTSGITILVGAVFFFVFFGFIIQFLTS